MNRKWPSIVKRWSSCIERTGLSSWSCANWPTNHFPIPSIQCQDHIYVIIVKLHLDCSFCLEAIISTTQLRLSPLLLDSVHWSTHVLSLFFYCSGYSEKFTSIGCCIVERKSGRLSQQESINWAFVSQWPFVVVNVFQFPINRYFHELVKWY